MKNVLILCISVFVFAGCAAISAPKDILSDRLSEERVYTAIKNYGELIKLNKEKLKTKDNEKNRLALANNYYEIGDFDSALYYILPLLESKKSAGANLLKAKILENKDEDKEAMQFANECISIDDKNALCHNVLGVLHAKAKDFLSAKSEFLRAKELFLDDRIVNNNLALISILKGNYEMAINYLEPLYKRGIKEPQIIANLIFAYAKTKNEAKAIELIKIENISRSPKLFLTKISQIVPNENYK